LRNSDSGDARRGVGAKLHLPAMAAKADRDHTHTLGGRWPGCNDLAWIGTFFCNCTNRDAAALLRYLWCTRGQSLPMGSGRLIGPHPGQVPATRPNFVAGRMLSTGVRYAANTLRQWTQPPGANRRASLQKPARRVMGGGGSPYPMSNPKSHPMYPAI